MASSLCHSLLRFVLYSTIPPRGRGDDESFYNFITSPRLNVSAVFYFMIKVFKYIPELDCFDVTAEFKKIVDELGITEWNEVVWIGRYFSMDNDFGEHWFDNWDEREKFENKADELGLYTEQLFFIDPDRFKNDNDGPCHTTEERKRFWSDVCLSLHLSLETIFSEARKINQELKELLAGKYIENLEERIHQIANQYK
jgi:hypothetical protein